MFVYILATPSPTVSDSLTAVMYYLLHITRVIELSLLRPIRDPHLLVSMTPPQSLYHAGGCLSSALITLLINLLLRGQSFSVSPFSPILMLSDGYTQSCLYLDQASFSILKFLLLHGTMLEMTFFPIGIVRSGACAARLQLERGVGSLYWLRLFLFYFILFGFVFRIFFFRETALKTALTVC